MPSQTHPAVNDHPLFIFQTFPLVNSNTRYPFLYDYFSNITLHRTPLIRLQSSALHILFINLELHRDSDLISNVDNYLFQLNVYILMFLESFLLFAQHVSDITAPIIRSTTVVYAAISFRFWCVYSVRLVLVFCHKFQHYGVLSIRHTRLHFIPRLWSALQGRRDEHMWRKSWLETLSK
jgi:hypothetical protein